MSEQNQWPIYKGPIKVPYRKQNRLYPERMGKHGIQYEPKHKGNDSSYQLFIGHYQPKHKKRNYRYAKDGVIRKVLPRSTASLPIQSISPEKRIIPKGPQEPPPPRNLLIHLYNDRFVDHFSLEAYRASRAPLSWKQRFRTFNYFREVCMVEGILMLVGLLFAIQEDTVWRIVGGSMLVSLLILFPITALAAGFHHIKKDRK